MDALRAPGIGFLPWMRYRGFEELFMDSVHLLTFNEVAPAQALKARLQQAGVPAEIKDERRIQQFIFLSPPLGSLHVLVDHHHYERAQALIRDWDQREGVLSAALHCPQCGSSRVQFPQFTRKVIISWVGALACSLGLMERKFYCKQCHYTWPVKRHSEPAKDILGWPKKQGQEPSR